MEVPSTYGMVWHRSKMSFELFQFNRPVSRAYNMIKDKKCVPLDPKAEYYLYSCGLPIYTDNKEKLYSRHNSGVGDFYVTCVMSDKGFCLRTRSHINNHKFGKLRDTKFIQGECYEYYPGSYFNDLDERMVNMDLCNYKDPYLLFEPLFQGGFVFGQHPTPEKVQYILNTVGEKERVVFMNAFDQKVKKKTFV